MAKDTMDFAQQDTERAMQATNWMRAIAERNLNQTKGTFDGLLAVTPNAVRDLACQTAAICEHSLLLAEEPQELRQIQSDFISRQVQLPGDQTKELGQDHAGSTRRSQGHAGGGYRNIPKTT
jgi:hypothetical protein